MKRCANAAPPRSVEARGPSRSICPNSTGTNHVVIMAVEQHRMGDRWLREAVRVGDCCRVEGLGRRMLLVEEFQHCVTAWINHLIQRQNAPSRSATYPAESCLDLPLEHQAGEHSRCVISIMVLALRREGAPQNACFADQAIDVTRFPGKEAALQAGHEIFCLAFGMGPL